MGLLLPNDNSMPLALRPGVATRDTHESLESPDGMAAVSQCASIRGTPRRNHSFLSLGSLSRSPSPNILPPIPMTSPASSEALILFAPHHLQSIDSRGYQRFQL
jgi:hypothetical protein